MPRNIRLNHKGIEAVAKSAEMKRAVEAIANDVADNLRAQGIRVEHGAVELPVEVSVYETDRARASVTITHAAGLAVQAKYGSLTRAASQAGLEVKGE